MNFLQEAIADFIKEGTFFKVAKKYKPELAKMMISFFQKKGVDGFDPRGYRTKPIKYNELKGKDKKERRKVFREIVSSLNIEKEFFAAIKPSGYNKGQFKFANLLVDGYRIEFYLSSNEEFFEDGHDFHININKESGDYKTIREYENTGKINILRPVNDVLENMWLLIQKALGKYKSGDESEKEERVYSKRKHTKTDIERMVEIWLNRYYKVYKSGRKKQIDDYDKKPYNFHVNMKSPKDNTSMATFGRGGNGFTISFRLNKLNRTSKNSSGYYRQTEYNDKLTSMWPDLEEWIEIYNKGASDAGLTGYDRYISIDQLVGDKFTGPEHLEVYKKLEYLSKRFAKMGYFPIGNRNSYNRDQNYSIEFRYSDKIKKAAQEPDFTEKLLNSPKFKQNVKNTFFHEGSDISHLDREIMTRWWKLTEKRN